MINDRPRECLGYRTPNEVFFDISPSKNAFEISGPSVTFVPICGRRVGSAGHTSQTIPLGI